MERKYTKDKIFQLWGTHKTITIDKEKYYVNKMSYGEFFAEPINWKGGETDGFSPKVKWFSPIMEINQYGINQLYFRLDI